MITGNDGDDDSSDESQTEQETLLSLQAELAKHQQNTDLHEFM